MQLKQPKSIKEINTIQQDCLTELNNLVEEVSYQLTQINEMASASEDASGLIEDCISRFPTFVPNIRKIRTITEQMNIVLSSLNDNNWLESVKAEIQLLKKKKNSDEDDSSSSSGGLGLSEVYKNSQITANFATDINMTSNMLLQQIYQLQHSQDLFYNKTATHELQKNIDVIKAKQNEVKQTIEQSLQKSKTMGK